ncbi:MAG: Maff2 family protein [Ruminococcus sp.]|nr:Maff2 family protein [Ruminococcus sp.]
MDGFGFFSDAVSALQTVLVLIGAGVGALGIFNLLEAYSDDNGPGKNKGIKQLMSGGGIVLLATILIPKLTSLMNSSGGQSS